MWLPGDARGWVDRARGLHRGGYKNSSVGLERRARDQMTASPYKMSLKAANVVLMAIREVCVFREWSLLACHVRPTHVHCVVSNVQIPHRAVADFKSYASRRLNATEGPRKRWARDGSTRPLLSDDAV